VGSDALECWVLGDELDEPMLTFIEQLSGERSLDRRIWRRASLPGDPPLEGMRLRREIIRMDADLTSFAGAERPGGITKRPFRPGFDEDRWIALNALAFESHPEQSEVGHHELSARMSESWFDPEGFLLVEDDEGLAGFCWTKVHDDPWGSSGEIYVIGVAPRCAGRGIGRFAVAAGLEHLRSVGITDAFLYVEAGNDVAVSLYRSLGFEERWRDQLWETTS
jgi:mycothiol synthase